MRNGKQSASAPALVSLEVENACDEPLRLVWVPDGDAHPVEYAQLAPHESMTQQSSVGHRWQLRRIGSNAVVAEASVTASTSPQLLVSPCAEESFYAQSLDAGVAKIQVRASANVAAEALDVAAHIVRAMLRDAPPGVLSVTVEACCYAVLDIISKSLFGFIIVFHGWGTDWSWFFGECSGCSEPSCDTAECCRKRCKSDHGVCGWQRDSKEDSNSLTLGPKNSFI